MSTPPSAASRQADAKRSSFADDVAHYLGQTPRQLPSKYLYDELGSALFEAICRLPWYALTRSEQRLLRLHARDVFQRLDHVSTVVELGPGSGEKLKMLLSARPPARDHLTAHLIDVSSTALRAAQETLADLSLTCVLHEQTYEEGLAAVGRTFSGAGRTLVAFLGSNIGNFDPPAAHALLRQVRAIVREGDALLLGADLVKPEPELLLAYDDPLGVTAAFNRNLLVRINRELCGDFDVDRFAHRAVWNAGASRVEMHLVSERRQRVSVRGAGVEITFEPGETIWTESSYKYTPAAIDAMLGAAGFHVVEEWVDAGFALTLAAAG
jgi:L-histidine Nalpha-methyltransferase